jgi:hypothetical protein
MLKKNTKKVDKTPVGELRPSQMLYTYGVGAIIDLPRIAAMVMGLDDWDITYSTEVVEERLLAAVRAELGESVTSLRTPPLVKDTLATSVSAAFIGVPVASLSLLGAHLRYESACRTECVSLSARPNLLCPCGM